MTFVSTRFHRIAHALTEVYTPPSIYTTSCASPSRSHPLRPRSPSFYHPIPLNLTPNFFFLFGRCLFLFLSVLPFAAAFFVAVNSPFFHSGFATTPCERGELDHGSIIASRFSAFPFQFATATQWFSLYFPLIQLHLIYPGCRAPFRPETVDASIIATIVASCV